MAWRGIRCYVTLPLMPVFFFWRDSHFLRHAADAAFLLLAIVYAIFRHYYFA